MSLYGRLFAASYDAIMSGPEKAVLHEHRKALLGRVAGRVIEIGGGTGANLPFYGQAVEQLIITEPEEPMARRLERKLRDYPLPVQVVRARAEELPFDDQSFDYAVSTLVLCTVDAPERALEETHRVLKPGGQLLFIEHVRSQEARLARWQDRLNGFMIRFGHGCNCNRQTLDNIRHAGLPISELTHDELRKDLPICRPLIVGAADRP